MKNINRHVIHLCGSPTNDFFFNLSLIYSKNILLPPSWEQSFIKVDPKKNFYFMNNSNWKLVKFNQLIKIIPPKSLIVPHLFCYDGMTKYRNYFENNLGLPLVGSTGKIMTLSINKDKTKKLVNKAGVRVPNGLLIKNDQIPKLKFPVILKPNFQDNSTGVRLIYKKDQYRDTITFLQRKYGDILAEEYIPGREIRVAVIEYDSEFYVPEIIEYPVSETNPIRKIEDKLDIKNNEVPYQQASNTSLETICPAVVDDKLKNKIISSAILAHKSIGARHYSLFDFRIDEQTNEPIFLEAGLFWSFSKASMISKMLLAGGQDLVKIIDKVWSDAIVNF